MRWTRRTAIAGAISAGVTSIAHASRPSRIVSLNPCIDTILVHVADTAQIAALSHYSRQESSSTIAEIARTLPFTYQGAEEIVALSPDLVLASRYAGGATRHALDRIGVQVEPFGVPDTVEDSIDMVLRVAELAGHTERGEALVRRIRQAIADATPAKDRRPIRALVFQPRGLVAGSRTLVDEMLSRTGFENVAMRYGVGSWGSVPLERVIADPPELLLAPQKSPGVSSWAERIVSHPALARVASSMQRATFPEACLYCGGPVLLQTARVLAEAREQFWSQA